jgi:flagellar motor switch protein FliN/FliY
MTTPANLGPVDLFCGPLLSAFGDVLSQVSGQPWKIDSAQAETAAAEVEVGFECQGAVRGPFAFRMSTAIAIRLAKLLMSEPVPEDVAQLSGDDREALEELLRQAAGIAATRLKPDFGKLDLTFVGPSTAAQDGEQFPFSAAAGSEALHLQICIGKELRESLASRASESKDAEVKPVAAAPPVATALPSSAPTGALTVTAIREGNLELLWDVALSLTLRFGQRELLLKEILELSPGAVLELDREVNEPVDLLLGRKVIARGEVVIVDGNYGLRVTEVASAAEKLACLP